MNRFIAWLRKQLFNRASRRAIVSIIVFVLLWEVGSRSKEWLGHALPWVGMVPAPSAVLKAWAGLLADPGYWQATRISRATASCGCSPAP
jgi:NitT/TauT family transport system permease protein